MTPTAPPPVDDEVALRHAALRNVAAIQVARERADQQLRERSDELARSVALLQATFDAANDAMLAIDADGRATVANQVLLDLWRIGRSDLFRAGTGALHLLQQQVLEPADFAAEAIRGQGPLELRFHSGVIVECSVRPQLVAGESSGHVWVFREVTRERRTRAALEHARAHAERLATELEQRVRERTHALELMNRSLEAFSYSVSHDLRAPLGSIDGFAQALHEALRGRLNEREEHYLARVRANVQRMGGLIDSLLALARFSKGALLPQEVDVSAIATRVLADLRDQEPDRAVRLHVEPGLRAWADPSLLEVVLQNLLRNAWKFSSRQPVCDIEVREALGDPGHSTLVVEDRGTGFDSLEADRLFRPFTRLHSEAEFAGHGVGLAMVLSIAQRHGGKAWAEGEAGRGARFYVSLPLRPA